ncbi:MAG: class I SAM-dependent methyltransferase [Planctomycetota bacterium]
MNVYDEADLYCAAFTWSLEEEIDWLLAEHPRATNVLEPFCGHARYGPAFASRGVAYVGFDLAESMLARAPAGENITVVCADARDFQIAETPPGGFDLAWCPVNSLAHLTDEPEIVRHLRCVRRHLRPGGAYVVELALVHHDGPWQDPPGTENAWSVSQPDGSTVHAAWHRLDCDLVTRTCTERATFRRERGGQVLSEISSLYTMRMWCCADLARIASEAGLDLANRAIAHRDYEPGPAVELSPKLENNGLNYYFCLSRSS